MKFHITVDSYKTVENESELIRFSSQFHKFLKPILNK